jgi:hypothetical protein
MPSASGTSKSTEDDQQVNKPIYMHHSHSRHIKGGSWDFPEHRKDSHLDQLS